MYIVNKPYFYILKIVKVDFSYFNNTYVCVCQFLYNKTFIDP